MKNYMYKISSVLLLISILISCNKSKKYSNRLDGEKWQVKEITIDGSAASNLPEILFKECGIYKESCEGSWITPEGGRSTFIWQFRNKGKEFEISSQTDHAHNILDVKAAEQSISYSGVYKVVDSKRKELIIESAVAHGFTGKKVRMVFVRL